MLELKCGSCGVITRHRHEHGCAHGMPETHIEGSERFVCGTCGKATHSTSPGASKFPFVIDKVTEVTNA